MKRMNDMEIELRSVTPEELKVGEYYYFEYGMDKVEGYKRDILTEDMHYKLTNPASGLTHFIYIVKTQL